ncbi:hypothetical protein LV478_05095 [Komagataeibacter oboediens]|uniref:hypothetical protein n=1 Tax=Komagataeibacter oboediens TaxID=65958 RepID=UPI0023DC6D9E|nr:hypothetical protein [Komagataeibacter oboediens]WEQ52921.1 hypothetical protein LV478_05095 [Komagataeibacter oboediens]
MRPLPSMLAAAACLSACAHGRAGQTTIPAAMAGIQSTLAQAGVVSVSHAADWNAQQGGHLDQAVRAAQCAQQAADPIMGTITGDVTLQLAGSFTRSDQFTVGALTTAPTMGLETTAARTTSQQVSLSVSYAPLSSLPDVEMGRQMGYETALFGQNDPVRHSEARRLMADRDALRRIVRVLIRSWNGRSCPAPQPVAPLVSLRRDNMPDPARYGSGDTDRKRQIRDMY